MPVTRRRFLSATGTIFTTPYIRFGEAPYPPERIAPMVMVGFDGASALAPGARRMAEHIAAGRVGGVCFIFKNAVSRPGVESLTGLFQSAARHWPLLVAIDQEGGQVQRLSSHLGYGFEPSAIQIATSIDPAAARKTYHAMAVAMRSSGFNLNLAPVVDLGFEPRSASITRLGRSFGADPDTVIKYSRAFVEGHRDGNVLTALKHFPGHGSALLDSHESGVDVTKTWRPAELVPFFNLVQDDTADMIMIGHISHNTLTGGVPASLSVDAVTGLLRRDIGYDGVIITDDLDMRAVRRNHGVEEAAILAVAAGNDIVLFTNNDSDPDLPLRLIAAIQRGIAERRIAAAQIEASVARIDKLKHAMTMRTDPPRHRDL